MTGIPCPHCSATASHVLRTLAGDGRISRRRECSVCQARFSTAERLIGDREPSTATGIGVSIGDLAKSVRFLQDAYFETQHNLQNSTQEPNHE